MVSNVHGAVSDVGDAVMHSSTFYAPLKFEMLAACHPTSIPDYSELWGTAGSGLIAFLFQFLEQVRCTPLISTPQVNRSTTRPGFLGFSGCCTLLHYGLLMVYYGAEFVCILIILSKWEEDGGRDWNLTPLSPNTNFYTATTVPQFTAWRLQAAATNTLCGALEGRVLAQGTLEK